MTNSGHIQNIEARLALYQLDGRPRGAVRELWPLVAPHVEHAVDAILDATAKLPNIASIVAQNRPLIKNLEMAHLKALVDGELDADYFMSCRTTVEQEAALGIDARFRSTAGNYLLRAAVDALSRQHKFSRRQLIDKTKLLSQVLAFDVANAMTLHREAAERRSAERRQVIDEAIADFGAAIGAVLEAIKDASSSLTTTCTTMRE
ncbi:MAG TPA: protoglobin domain-containing protein, partial [Xanthobacteraceae bacterium]|nr:protoglobin domain-containing protein [Xanthobacteraceae bacterium]